MITNDTYDKFAVEVEKIPNGCHLVELMEDGGAIQITKPGYLGSKDFKVQLVALYNGEFMVIETPSHVTLLREFADAYEVGIDNGNVLMHEAMRVFHGQEPCLDEIRSVEGTIRTPEYILKALKWIWGQEDANFPMPKYLGRRMSGHRLCEVAHGVSFDTVHDRAEIKKGRPEPLKNVDYSTVDKIIDGDIEIAVKA
jgi:hypothetical protein